MTPIHDYAAELIRKSQEVVILLSSAGRCAPDDFSTCPPNSNRIADRSLSPNSDSPRELTRE